MTREKIVKRTTSHGIPEGTTMEVGDISDSLTTSTNSHITRDPGFLFFIFTLFVPIVVWISLSSVK